MMIAMEEGMVLAAADVGDAVADALARTRAAIAGHNGAAVEITLVPGLATTDTGVVTALPSSMLLGRLVELVANLASDTSGRESLAQLTAYSLEVRFFFVI